MVLNRTLYAVFVGLVAFSPLLSLILSGTFGYPAEEVDWARFLWVGPALSLPATLTAARLLGAEQYCAYWTYLKSFRASSSKRTIIVAWAAATVMTAAGGFALTR